MFCMQKVGVYLSKIKEKWKLLIYFVLGIIIGASTGIFIYSHIPPSYKTVQEFLNNYFLDFPDYQLDKELFSAMDKGYFMVFYLNPSNSVASALFDTKNTDWEDNYISNLGCTYIPKQSDSYPLMAQGIHKSDENMFVWGLFNNQEVEKVTVCGQRATVIELDNVNLWFSIVTDYPSRNNSEAMLWDKDKNLIKSIYF